MGTYLTEDNVSPPENLILFTDDITQTHNPRQVKPTHSVIICCLQHREYVVTILDRTILCKL